MRRRAFYRALRERAYQQLEDVNARLEALQEHLLEEMRAERRSELADFHQLEREGEERPGRGR